MDACRWDWLKTEAENTPSLLELFESDATRPQKLAVDITLPGGEICFDFSKTHLTADIVEKFAATQAMQRLPMARTAMFSGAIANITEGRAATHIVERGSGNPDMAAQAEAMHQRMFALIDAIEQGTFGTIKHILHIGIGGSALGPDLLVDALGRDGTNYDVAIVSNIDGIALEDAFRRFNAQHTLIAIASKTFTTTETLRNAASALEWMKQEGVEDPYGRCIALTAAPEKANEWGIDDMRILPFAETVGGRYSLWSSIGFPAAAALGVQNFKDLLRGAAAMDRHFQEAPTERNVVTLAAMADQVYLQGYGAQTRAVFAYDERLRLLPDYLQQLEMESNGKSVTLDNQTIHGNTAPITWGGVGTDAQHAVFQLLHQGTHIVPVEFITSITPGHDLAAEHHASLLGNCFAQGAALMTGRQNDDPSRNYSGNRPSTTILLDDINPASLGALIAFYEHRTFTNAVFMNINPFDQFGVELGKAIAKQIEAGDVEFDASTTALLAKAGLSTPDEQSF